MMIPLDMLIYGIALPVTVSSVLLLIIAPPWRRELSIARLRAAAPFAIGLGYAIGHLGLYGRPSFPPVESWQWLLVLAAAATLLGALDAIGVLPIWVRRGLAWLLLALAPWLLVKL